MVVTELAEASLAYYAGELVVMSGLPIAGLILLIVGIRQRSRARQLPPGYPPPGPFPYGPAPEPPAPQMPPQYYPGAYPPPRPARSGLVLIVVGSLMLAGGLLGIIGGATDLAKQNRTANSPDVGQCIGAYNFRDHSKSPKAQDCAKPDSIFEVVTRGGESATCPDGKSDDSDYAFLRDGSTTLCFILNFSQGRCYTASGDAHDPLFAATDCDGSVPSFKVVSRFDGNSDTESCPLGTKAISYKVPARLYCLQPLRK